MFERWTGHSARPAHRFLVGSIKPGRAFRFGVSLHHLRMTLFDNFLLPAIGGINRPSPAGTAYPRHSSRSYHNRNSCQSLFRETPGNPKNDTNRELVADFFSSLVRYLKSGRLRRDKEFALNLFPPRFTTEEWKRSKARDLFGLRRY